MQLSEPTTLHHGVDVATSSGTSGGLAWVAVIAPLLFALIWFIRIRNRRVRDCPQTHAFRALAKRMGLRSSELRAVESYARDIAQVEPIAVLMSTDMHQAALARS